MRRYGSQREPFPPVTKRISTNYHPNGLQMVFNKPPSIPVRFESAPTFQDCLFHRT